MLMYTEHSLWHKTVTPVRILNRATIGLDKALVAVSPAAQMPYLLPYEPTPQS